MSELVAKRRFHGYADGRPHRIFHQFPSDDSCRFSN